LLIIKIVAQEEHCPEEAGVGSSILPRGTKDILFLKYSKNS